MRTITLGDAQSHLAEIIEKLSPSEEVIILRGTRPVAKLSGAPAEDARPLPGRGRGMLTVLAEDDEHLEDFM